MTGRNDGLAELLVKLATDTATLIDRARASGAFRAPAQTVQGESVVRPAPAAEKAAGGTGDGAGDPQTGALQDIIVQQAMRVHALEAEVAKLRAAVAEAQAGQGAARKPAAGKKTPGARKSAAKATQ